MDKEGIHTKCLDRLVDNDSRVLTVGTLPGQESINAGRYYADKKNQFWNILYGAFNVPYDSRITDKEKCDFLRLHRIALWDVLEKGERKGSSSDKDIHRPVMNDFEELFTKYPLLRKVIINSKGLKKGRNKEMKDIAKRLKSVFDRYGITYEYLHSTSWRIRYKPEEIDKWHEILRDFVLEKEKPLC